MDRLQFFFQIGWGHIISIHALDHQLFILALITGFYLRDGFRLIILATAFTIGHSVTLALVSLKLLSIPSAWAEIAIAATILLTAFENLFISLGKLKSPLAWKYSSAFIFGLVHGMGFANNLKIILGKETSLLMPLLGFNFGIEAAQIVIIFIYLVISQVIPINWRKPFEWIISGIIILPASKMLIERLLEWGG